MRIRTVKPTFWTDEDIASLPDKTQLLALGLLNYADDEGYFKAHAALVKSAIFPFTDGSLNIHGMLSELEAIKYIQLTDGDDGKRYGRIVNFAKHQRVNRPSESTIRPHCAFTEPSVSAPGAITAGIRNKEGNEEQEGSEEPPRAHEEEEWPAVTEATEEWRYEQYIASFHGLRPEYERVDAQCIVAALQHVAEWGQRARAFNSWARDDKTFTEGRDQPARILAGYVKKQPDFDDRELFSLITPSNPEGRF